MNWTSGEKNSSNVYVTRRPFETNVSSCEEKFKSSTDVSSQTNTNNTEPGHNLPHSGGVCGVDSDVFTEVRSKANNKKQEATVMY